MKCNHFHRLAILALLLSGSAALGLQTASATSRGPTPHTARAWQVSSQRPRLLVHSGGGIGQGPTIAELRTRRLRQDRPRWAALSANNKGWEGLLTPSLRALLLGDLETRAMMIDRLKKRTQVKYHSSGRQAGGHMAIAFDWLYDSLSDSERQTIASNVANTALITDAQPLIPQAQGIKCSACCDSEDKAKGNGMPMKKASGAISAKLITILSSAAKVANLLNRSSRKNT